MSELSIYLFGTFRASLGMKLFTEFRTRKVQALLIYLAAEPEAHSRERLLDLLWPGLPEKSARSNLRQILYYLRQAIPELSADGAADVPAVIANRQEIRLNAKADVSVDTHEFERLLGKVQAHEHLDVFLCAACARWLEAAVALYRGDFLADFYLDDSNEFEEWAQARREYFRRKALDALGILARMALGRQDYAAAETWAHRQLEIDNLRESAYRQLMKALALSGRREQALAAYETCRRVLTEELGMAPAARTTEYSEKILAGDLRFDRSPFQGVRGYQLKEPIGEGAYGAIYRAVQPAVLREVAVKVIRRRFADDPEFIRRFEAEAQTVARLEHPYIVPLYDYWRDPAGAFLVMRYMRGGNLLEALEAGPWDVERTAAMVEQIAGALASAHRQGVVHRDIKPGNILLDEVGNAYLADFGIAKNLAGERQLTAEGAVVGSLDYISPEQITGDVVTAQTDIYSLGAVVYETLTGEKPFDGGSPARLLYSHLHEAMPLVTATRPGVSPEVDEVLQKATAKKPANRYASVREMAVAFRTAVRGPEPAPAGPGREALPALTETYNPYKGLRAFQEADADDFFGREALIQQCLFRLDAEAVGRESRFLALVGPSGSGKSSAVKAGLIPALRDGALPGSEKWFITEMVPGADPLAELERALWRVAVDPPPDLVTPMQRDRDGILRTVRRILPSEPASQQDSPQLLLVIDQFEELFTLVEDEARRAFFLDSLLVALEALRSPLRVVVTLRADFYDRPLQDQEWGKLLKERTEIVLPLNRTELTWAVREPAARMGVRLEEGLVPNIVADVADQPGALPLLQYALTELFEERDGRMLTHEAYAAIGGATGALATRAEELYLEQDEAGRKMIRQLFLRLVSVGRADDNPADTRRRVPQAELLALSADEDLLEEMVNLFATYRLLTLDHDLASRRPTVEVAHEALLREWGRLREWLNESRADIRLQRQLARAAREWENAGRDASFLIPGGTRLDQFETWSRATELAMTPQEAAYLVASLEAEGERQTREGRQARTRRNLQRAVIGTLGLGLIVAIGLSIFAFSRQRLAVASEQEALRQASIGLAGQAIAQLNSDVPERGVLLALAALEEYPYTPQAESALAQAVYRTHQYTLLRAVSNLVESIEFSPDGALVAGGEWKIVVWDAVSGKIVTEIDSGVTSSWVRGLAWLSDNSGLLTSGPGSDRIVRVWDLTTGEERVRYERHEGAVNSIYVSKDDLRALSGSADGTAHIWLIDSGETVQTLEEPEGEVTDAVWSPDERQIATASVEGTIRLWDSDTGVEVMRIDAHLGGVTALAWSSDGARLASSGNDGSGRVWNASTGELLYTLIGHDAVVRDIEWAPDGSHLATAGGDGLVRVWEARSGIERFALAGNYDEVPDVSWSPDGQRLAVSGGVLPRVWDVATPVVRLSGYGAGEYNVISTNWPYWSPDSSWVGVGGLDQTYRLWDPATGENIKTFKEVFRGFGAPSPSGKEIFLVNPPRIVNLDTGEARPVSVPEEIGNGYAIEWSPDGSLITLQGPPPVYPVYDAETLELLFNGQRRECGFLLPGVFSPDNNYLAQTCTLSDFTSVRITEALTGKVVKELEGHTDYTAAARWSPDGLKLATTSADLTARVWDVETGETLTVFAGHAALPLFVDWSPDGTRLVSGDAAGNVLVWDALTGEEVNRYNVGGYTFGNRWSPDGTRVLTTGTFDAPDIRPVWQSTEELIAYANECCVLRELTPEEREQFGLAAAEDGGAGSVR